VASIEDLFFADHAGSVEAMGVVELAVAVAED
jgi:hypothetical protein